jgi:thiamine-phosphate pyrophosphorylase
MAANDVGAGERAPVQLCLVTPADALSRPDFAAALTACLDAAEVASVEFDLDPAPVEPSALGVLVAHVQAHGVAALVAHDAALALAVGADGVRVAGGARAVREARRLLGPGLIVGTHVGISRHAAMDAGEAGADFVQFGDLSETALKGPVSEATAEVLGWWQEVMELPCVARGGISVLDGPAWAAAGADFLAVRGWIWDHPDGPARALAALSQALGSPLR